MPLPLSPRSRPAPSGGNFGIFEGLTGGASLLILFLIWQTRIPLGVPGEWVWERHPPAADYWWSLPTMLCLIAIFACWISVGYRRIDRCRLPESGAWLLGTVMLSFGWLWLVQEAAPAEMRLSKTVWVLYYPGPSGYFTEARYHATDFQQYLRDYETKLKEGDVLHIGTHPPGLIVGYRILMSIQQKIPWFFDWLDTWRPLSVRESMRDLQQFASGGPQPVEPADLSVLWGAALIMQLGAVATVIPLFFLLKEFFSHRCAWLLIHFWPFVPALNLFLPKSDAFFPLISVSILACWLIGWRRNSFFLCFSAGLISWAGLFCSLAFLPAIFLAVLLTVWMSTPCAVSSERTPLSLKRISNCVTAVVAGFFLPLVLANFCWKLNLISVWILNYRNHAGFYSQYVRTYWRWLLVNPVELSIALGIPLSFLAIRSVWSASKTPRTVTFGICLGICVTWGILWLTGKNMGEAARLWLFLMPWGIWMSGVSLQKIIQNPESDVPPSAFWGLWTGQVLFCMGIAARVIGFSIPGLSG